MTDFNRFVADNAGSLLRSAYLITGDLHEAEDLVQEALHRTARRWHKVQRMDHPAAYARRITVNLALDGAPKRSRAQSELSADGDESLWSKAGGSGVKADDETEALHAHDELVEALKQLPPRQRAVLVLRYFLDLPEAEVAAALDCSLGTVKSSASRGLARLAEALRPAPPTRSITT
jgi:RNA polymerase sigma-70 factor (sigma-E family)